jgi:hypothetical protein
MLWVDFEADRKEICPTPQFSVVRHSPRNQHYDNQKASRPDVYVSNLWRPEARQTFGITSYEQTISDLVRQRVED